MNKKSVLPALALALLARVPLNAAATGPVFQITNLTFNHSMLFNMINAAIQNPSGAIENFNAGNDGGVVSVTIRNTGSGQPAPCYFVPIVKQANGSCPEDVVATGPVVQTRTDIAPGQTLQANVSNLEVVAGQNFTGTGVCLSIKNLINGNFGGGGTASKLAAAGNAVNELEQLQLVICLEPSTQGGSLLGGEEACTEASVFEAPPSQLTTSAIEVYPNNTTISMPMPSFIWTPAMYNGSSIGLEYELVLSQSVNGNPWYSVLIPSGQTYYQWQATDRALQAGTTYYWHVVVIQASSNLPVGGQNGQGWIAPQSWFAYAPMGSAGPGSAVVTLQQLGTLVQGNASPAVLGALQGMQIQGASPFGSLSDPDVAALVAKPSEIKSISVEKF
jgi:hypothetical protein